VIEDFVHVAPGAVVCGNVQIGEGTLIGANAVIAPNLKIGKWCQISAGSSIFEDIPDNTVIR
jgi:acetyltransferase-like isoleucine patch superfamily enzyme